MKIQIKDRKTKPPFGFYVKENTSKIDYYVFDGFEEAMEQARLLSLTRFPVSIVLEPYENEYHEWTMKRIFVFYSGECVESEEKMLHVKFYTDAGECLNYDEIIQ